MKLTTIHKKIDAMLDLYHKLDKAVGEVAPIIGDFLVEWLKKNREIAEIRWYQYTPYFNDGDACLFTVHDPAFVPASESLMEDPPQHDDDLDRPGRYIDHWEYGAEKLVPSLKKKVEEELLPLFAVDRVMEEAFGDHVLVVATADGVSVEAHDHD